MRPVLPPDAQIAQLVTVVLRSRIVKLARFFLPALLPALVVAAPASAAFGPAQSLDLPVAGPVAAAVAPDGAATVAGLLPGVPVQARIEVATRSAAGAPWSIAGYATSARVVRDLQVVAGGRGPVLAWSEARRNSQSVVVATADTGAHLTVRERIPVANGFSAFPRLAVLGSGRVVLAWRDGRTSARARVRVATFDGERFTSAPRTAGTDASQIVIAARGGGATVGWISAHRFLPRKTKAAIRRVAPRSLTLRSLDRRGTPAGEAVTAGRDVGASARLAGAPDGRLVASWLRPQKILPYPGEDRGDPAPPSAFVSPVAFTRQMLPAPAPARPVGVAGAVVAGIPHVAFAAPDQAIAALRASAVGAGPQFDALTATSTAGGPWPAPQVLAHLGFSNFDPVVVAPASGPVVVFTSLIPDPAGRPRWAVGASQASGTQALGTTSAADGRGIGVASGGERVLVAWPSTTGGVQVAEQG